MDFIALLKEFYWLFLLLALIFLALTICFAFGSWKHKRRCKRIRKEVYAEKEKAEKLTVEIETLRGEIEAVRAILENRESSPPPNIPKTLDSEPLSPPLSLNEIIDPCIFGSTTDGETVEIRGMTKGADGNEIPQKHQDANRYTVKYDRLRNDWVIRKFNQSRILRRVSNKEEAVKIAKELARKHNAVLEKS